jgi:hypothetical protein
MKAIMKLRNPATMGEHTIREFLGEREDDRKRYLDTKLKDLPLTVIPKSGENYRQVKFGSRNRLVGRYLLKKRA